MKLIGKQIVVELPGERKPSEMLGWTDKDIVRDIRNELKGYNIALSEVAKMNQAWEMSESEMANIILIEFYRWKKIRDKDREGLHWHIAQALASNPSAWMKRKE